MFELTPSPALETRMEAAGARVAERTHAWYRDNLGAALDGEMSEAEAALVDAHLARCPSCAAFRRTLERTIRATASLPSVTAPASAKQRVLGSLP